MTATTIDYIIVRLVASERRLRRQATTTGRRRPTTTAAAILLCAALYSRPMATATNRNSGVAVTQWYSHTTNLHPKGCILPQFQPVGRCANSIAMI